MEIPQELIVRCIRGDRKAEFELYRLLYSFMMGICKRYLSQEEKARELLNMGYYRVLKNIGSYRPDAPFIFWVRRVMINTLINEYKKEKIHYSSHSYVENYHDSAGYTDINNALETLDNEEIRRHIEKLPAASRRVFNLYFIDGLKHSEIAELLKISEGTSKWHLKFARDKLREIFKDNLIRSNS
jgi:RNA polymerase sigma factor (sigma-70 family)